MNKDDKLKALDAALTQIEKAYGKHWKPDTHGTGAVPDRNFGTRVPPAGTYRKSFLFTATATMIHFC